MEEPLLDTVEANAIEFYDQNNELTAVYGKVFSDDFWAFSTKEDQDWPQVLTQLGYIESQKSDVGGKGNNFFNLG
jgi:hypothetical protein